MAATLPRPSRPKHVRMRADTFRAHLRLGLELPDLIYVPEGLKLSRSSVERLCEGLCVDGELALHTCARLIALPSRLS